MHFQADVEMLVNVNKSDESNTSSKLLSSYNICLGFYNIPTHAHINEFVSIQARRDVHSDSLACNAKREARMF